MDSAITHHGCVMAVVLLAFMVMPLLVTTELDANRLAKFLINNSQRAGADLERPMYDHNDTMFITFGVSLVRAKLDAEKSELALGLYLFYSWQNIILTWDPEAFAGVKEIHIDPKDMWTPDILAHNSVDEMQIENTLAVVKSNGIVMWVPPVRLTVDCFRMPNGTYTCPLVLGSWMYDVTKIDLNLTDDSNGLDMSVFHWKNSNIEVLSHQLRRNEKYCPGFTHPFVHIEVSLNVHPTTW